MSLIEAVARQLYLNWCDDFGHQNPDVPDWDVFNAGLDLNPVGLNRNNFIEDAMFIAPYDTAEAVARRMCINNGIQECCMPHDGRAACSEATCEGWEEWLPYAERVLEVVRQHASTPSV